MPSPSSKPPTKRASRLASWHRDALAFIAGTTMPLAFAPFNLFIIGILAPAALFVLWLDAEPRRAARYGFWFGLGMFGVGVSWIYVSLHDFGNMPMALAVVAVFLFVAIFSVFPALLGLLQARIADPALRLAVFLPAAWVLLEWIRGWLFTGFPWLTVGYSQIDSPLAGLAPYIGVFGVSWATIETAGLLVLAWRHRRWARYVPVALALWLFAWGAGQIEWVRPVDGPLRVSLVQADVPLTMKWDPRWRQAIIDEYLRLSEAHRDSALVIWPETAVPAYLDELDQGFLQGLAQVSAAKGPTFLFGVIERDFSGAVPRIYNSVISTGDQIGVYRKRHLVPFGEYLPLSWMFSWLLDYLHIPMSDFSAWPAVQTPLHAAGEKIGVSICYEDVFGEEVIQALPRATVLANVSEDAWFGDSLAPYQHLQMARMRARESGRPMVRATNTGITAAIDHRGHIVAEAPPFQRYVLTAAVQPMQGATPYVRLGNLPVVISLIAIVAFLLLGSHRLRP